MNPEDPPLPPDCELVLVMRQPKRMNPVFRGCMVVTILLALAVLAAPLVIRSKKKAEQTEAVSNLRQMGIALQAFETEYGTFPDDNTKESIGKKHPGHGFNLSGKSSNALFRQLFAAKITESESIFYAEVKGTQRPDGNISPGEALKKGEVGFGYIAGVSKEGNPVRPVAFAPIIPGTDRFDPKPFEGMAVILRIDCSVTSVNIDPNGHVFVGGMNLLSPENPIWDGDKLDIRYPE
jgi:type II secretory pathway pseudopilin PulG